MLAVILANDELKNEWLAYPIEKDLSLKWVEDIADFKNYSFADIFIDLLFENTKERIASLHQFQAQLIIINSVITPLKEIKEDFIRINGWKTFLQRPVIEAACNNESKKRITEQLFSSPGRKIEWVPDIIGFITPRVVASVINEAFMALEEKVSNQTEIDAAMKLGTNYPYGPFEWAEKIGLEKVYNLLNALHKEHTRYQPSKLLMKKVLA